jgi:hypothetical protein
MAKNDGQISTEITNIKTLITSDGLINAAELQRVLNSLNDNKINSDKLGTFKFTPSGSSNFTQAIPADRLISFIIITNAAGLSALKVGTSAGADNIIPEQSMIGTVEFNVGRHHANNVTLYFSGITSATTVKIYTQ